MRARRRERLGQGRKPGWASAPFETPARHFGPGAQGFGQTHVARLVGARERRARQITPWWRLWDSTPVCGRRELSAQGSPAAPRWGRRAKSLFRRRRGNRLGRGEACLIFHFGFRLFTFGSKSRLISSCNLRRWINDVANCRARGPVSGWTAALAILFATITRPAGIRKISSAGTFNTRRTSSGLAVATSSWDGCALILQPILLQHRLDFVHRLAAAGICAEHLGHAALRTGSDRP